MQQCRQSMARASTSSTLAGPAGVAYAFARAAHFADCSVSTSHLASVCSSPFARSGGQSRGLSRRHGGFGCASVERGDAARPIAERQRRSCSTPECQLRLQRFYENLTSGTAIRLSIWHRSRTRGSTTPSAQHGNNGTTVGTIGFCCGYRRRQLQRSAETGGPVQ